MGEIKRVLFSGKTVLFLLLLIVFSCWQYTYQAVTKDPENMARYAVYREMMDGFGEWRDGAGIEKINESLEMIRASYETEEDPQKTWIRESAALQLLNQVTYLDGYDTYLEKIEKDSAYIQNGGVFGSAGGYSTRNAKKTEADYRRMADVEQELSLVPVAGFESIMQNDLTGFLAAGFCLYLVLSLVHYQKRGLWEMIYGLSGGRLKLALSQTGILLLGSIVSVAALYGTRIAAAVYWFGESDFYGFPVQCAGVFQKCTMQVSMFQMLGIIWFWYTAAVFVMALLFWLVCQMIRQEKLAVLSVVLIIAFEYIAYIMISSNSSLVYLRVINLVSLMNLQEVFRTYLNVNMFGHPVGQKEILFVFSVVLFILGAFGGTGFMVYRRPKNSSNLGERAADWMRKQTSKMAGMFPAVFSEARKVLFFEHGILVWALFFWFSYTMFSSDSVLYLSVGDGIRDEIYQEMTGMTVTEAQGLLEEKIQENQARLSELEQAKTDYESGKIGLDEYTAVQTFLRGAGIYAVQYENAKADLTRILNKDKNAHVVSPYGMELLAGRLNWRLDDMDRQRYQKRRLWFLYELVILVFLLAGIHTVERKSKMNRLLLSLPGGRRKLQKRKVRLAVFMVLLLSLLGSGFQVIQLVHSGASFGGFLESAAVLEIFDGFPMWINLGMVLTGIFLIRLLLLTGVAGILLGIGSRCRSAAVASVVGSILFLLPGAVEYLTETPGLVLAVLDGVQLFWENPVLMLVEGCAIMVFGVAGYAVSCISVKY